MENEVIKKRCNSCLEEKELNFFKKNWGLESFTSQCKLCLQNGVKVPKKEILNDGQKFICIRGWGNLTGTGGYHFTSEKASKIQDDFRDWIIYKLSTLTT